MESSKNTQSTAEGTDCSTKLCLARRYKLEIRQKLTIKLVSIYSLYLVSMSQLSRSPISSLTSFLLDSVTIWFKNWTIQIFYDINKLFKSKQVMFKKKQVFNGKLG